MPVPLHQVKAELFRNLGHPTRVRVLELLLDGPQPVQELLADLQIEPSSLSQQLAVLRRSGLVTSTRQGSAVVYTLSTPDVGDLMVVARRILTSVLADQEDILTELRAVTAAP